MKITKVVTPPVVQPPPRYVIEASEAEFKDLVTALSCNVTVPHALREHQMESSASAYERSCARIIQPPITETSSK